MIWISLLGTVGKGVAEVVSEVLRVTRGGRRMTVVRARGEIAGGCQNGPKLARLRQLSRLFELIGG